MHNSAFKYGGAFVETYLPDRPGLTILDVGSQNINGSLRDHMRPGDTYIGVDFVEGPNVDLVMSDPYKLPFGDESVDAIMSSSCFEHSEFFWELFTDMVRVLKGTGLIFLSAPANGSFHRYPVDCWRFYPDSGRALERWANKSGHNVAMLESFTGSQGLERWNDFVAVFVKDERYAPLYPKRIQDTIEGFTNGLVHGSDDVRHYATTPEDIAMRWWDRAARKFGYINFAQSARR